MTGNPTLQLLVRAQRYDLDWRWPVGKFGSYIIGHPRSRRKSVSDFVRGLVDILVDVFGDIARVSSNLVGYGRQLSHVSLSVFLISACTSPPNCDHDG